MGHLYLKLHGRNIETAGQKSSRKEALTYFARPSALGFFQI